MLEEWQQISAQPKTQEGDPLVLCSSFCFLMQLFFSEEQLIIYMEVNLIFSLCWKLKKMESGTLFHIVLLLPTGVSDGPLVIHFSE